MTTMQAIIIRAAQMGNRVIVNDKVIWKGLGNRAGLHSFAQTMLDEAWRKSAKKFLSRIDALGTGDTVEIQTFRNITRDRGRWIRRGIGTIGKSFMWL
jgi:hypothetical protein